jgi:peroxiredoxin
VKEETPRKAEADKKAEEKDEEMGDEEAPEAKEGVEEEAPDKATLDKKAPDFTLKNADGKEVKLSDFKGKIVVLEWINLDCPWCKAHYENTDALVKLQKEYRGDDIAWLTICSSAKGKQGNFEGETLTKRIEKAGLDSASYLIDADGAVGKKYEARTTPHTYVIDKEGVLKYRGALDNLRERRRDKSLEEVNYVKLAVNALKDDKKVETSETTPYG